MSDHQNQENDRNRQDKHTSTQPNQPHRSHPNPGEDKNRYDKSSESPDKNR